MIRYLDQENFLTLALSLGRSNRNGRGRRVTFPLASPVVDVFRPVALPEALAIQVDLGGNVDREWSDERAGPDIDAPDRALDRGAILGTQRRRPGLVGVGRDDRVMIRKEP